MCLFMHRGNSMSPLLKPGDLLEVDRASDRQPRLGDVIVIKASKGYDAVAHRIIAMEDDGWQTRGDNNRHVDPGKVSRDRLLGIVVARWRGSQRKKMKHGWRARFSGQLCHGRVRMVRGAILTLGPIYRWVSAHSYIARLIPKSVGPTVVAFRTKDVVDYRLMWGRKAIGWYDKAHRTWAIKRPFRPFVRLHTLVIVDDPQQD